MACRFRFRWVREIELEALPFFSNNLVRRSPRCGRKDTFPAFVISHSQSNMSAPEWTKDEKSLEEAKDYLRQGNTVDFFEQIASALLREHPTNVAQFAHDLVADIRAGKPPKSEGDFQPKKEEDNKYMRANKVSEFLDKWILALLVARPSTDAERLEFHQTYLKDVAESTPAA